MKIELSKLLSLPVLAATLAVAACGDKPEPEAQQPDSLLYVWAYDEDKKDPAFLMVIDADPVSAGYGTLLGTVPTEGVGIDAHHTNHQLPPSGRIFANDFRGGRTHIFETAGDPFHPVYKGSFEDLEGYYRPHTFVELPNGNVLATFQYKDNEGDSTGGILELSPVGEVVRSVDVEDPAIPILRPYSVEVLPALDRVVMLSADMMGKVDDHRVQIRLLSDLKLLATLELPETERADARIAPLESRVLADGQSVYVSTYMCGLFHLTGLQTDRPKVSFVRDWGLKGCAIPLVIGNYYLLALGENQAVAVLDTSDPENPVEVSRVTFDDEFRPHWIGANAAGSKVALTGYGDHLRARVMMLDFDPDTGALSVDENFGAGDEYGPGLMINIDTWPHGGTGPAVGHGSVFWDKSDK